MILQTSMGELILNFLYSIVLGVLLGLVYDLFRILRIALGAFRTDRKKHFESMYSKGVKRFFKGNGGKCYSYIVTALCDVLFFTLSACAFSVFLFAFNYGIFRWFLLLGCIVGFRLYYISLGKAVVAISVTAADFITLAFNCVLTCIVVPVILLARLIKRPAVKFLLPLWQKTVTDIDRRRLKRYTLNSIDKLGDIVQFR